MSVRTDNVNVNVVINGHEQGTTLKQMKGDLRQLKRELDQLTVGTQEWANKKSQVALLDKEIKQLNGTTRQSAAEFKQSAEGASSAKEEFKAMGAVIGAVLIAKVVEFGKESVTAFLEAEKNAKSLEFAVKNIGGESGSAVDKLIKQSEDLQGIFSDDDIQIAERELAVMELNSQQIAELTPKIIDMAVASGKTLPEATQLAIQGINGKTKGLKMLGIEFKDTGSKAENYRLLTEQMAKFEGAHADALTTTAGRAEKLSNEWDNVKESFGEYLVNEGSKMLDFWDILTGKLSMHDKAVKDLTEQYTNGYVKAASSVIQTIDEQDISVGQKLIKTNNSMIGIQKTIKALNADFSAGKITVDQYKIQITALQASYKNFEDYKASLIKPKTQGNDLTDEQLAAIEKQKNELSRLRDELEKIRREQELAQMSAHDRELAKVQDKYNKLREMAKGHAAELKQINELEANELAALDKKRADARMAEERKRKEAEDKETERRLQSRRNVAEKIYVETLSENEREIFAEQQKWDKLILLAEQNGLDSTNLRAAQAAAILNIQAKQAEQELQLQRQAHSEKMQMIEMEAQLMTNVADIFTGLFDLIGGKNSEFAEFQKQFAIFQIAIDTATAISKAVATGSAVGLTPIEKAIAITGNIALVVANMAKAKKILSDAGDAPKFEKGTMLTGSRHSQGGINMIDTRSGQLVGNAEAGEVILSRNTVKNNPDLVSALLDTSMNKNGAPLNSPFTYRPRNVSFSSARTAIAGNSIFSAPSSSAAAPGFTSLRSSQSSGAADLMAQNLQVMQDLRNLLASGIVARLSHDQYNRDKAAIDTAKRSGQIGG